MIQGLLFRKNVDGADEALSIDGLLAKALCRHFGVESRCVEAFIAYLFAQTQLGHLYVTRASIEKEPASLSLLEGMRLLPKTVCHTLENIEEEVEKPIVAFDGKYYLQRYWQCEVDIIRSAAHLLQKTCEPLPFDDSLLSFLTEEQKNLVIKGMEKAFLLVSGGPGTGKTHTMETFIHCFYTFYANQGKYLKIYLTAPTGKAVLQIKNRLLNGGKVPPSAVEAGTLHSLLDKKWTQGLLVVDESSMVDVEIMARLLKKSISMRVVLVGDQHQLPPVECGMAFAHLCDFAEKRKQNFATLTVCHRSDQKPLVDFAKNILDGNIERLRKLAFESPQIHVTSRLDLHKVAERFAELLQQPDLETLFVNLKKFCLLSPLHYGDAGVAKLNQSVREALTNTGLPTPIIIQKTCYRMKVFNGETGFILSSGNHAGKAVFLSEIPGKWRIFTAAMLPKYTSAYAISIHKSQGSEYDEVALILPEGMLLDRSLLYTGVTRVKKKLTLVGDFEQFLLGARRSRRLFSNIAKGVEKQLEIKD